MRDNKDLESKLKKENDEKPKSKKKIVIIAFSGVVVLAAIIALIAVMYYKAGFRTLRGSFGYSIKYNTREYEFTATANSLDIFQIKEEKREKNTSDSYIYLWEYSDDQDLQETLDIINEYEHINLEYMNIKIGAKKYPAIFVSLKNDKGDYQYTYFIDYNGHKLGIQTCSDKKHNEDIEAMLDSLTLID